MSPPDPAGSPYHERVHARACRGERLRYRWVPRGRGRGRVMVVESSVPWGRRGKARAAVALMAGALAGGGDAGGDRRAAAGLAREARVPVAEVEQRARRYL